MVSVQWFYFMIRLFLGLPLQTYVGKLEIVEHSSLKIQSSIEHINITDPFFAEIHLSFSIPNTLGL